MRAGDQYKLFDTPTQFENGLVYRPNFISPEEEELLLEFISGQRLKHAKGGDEGQYESKRRYKSFGWGYDYRRERIIPGEPLPRFLTRFSHRIEKWLNLPRDHVIEALINEYPPGTSLGFHRDNEPFEHVIGISLSGWANMRFRPLSWYDTKDSSQILKVEMEPRSAYIMQREVRWKWQHSVATTRTLRYSITFRTLSRDVGIAGIIE